MRLTRAIDVALGALVLACICAPVAASLVNSTGVAEITIAAGKPDAGELHRALKSAKDKAIARALKQQGRNTAMRAYRGCPLDEDGHDNVIIDYYVVRQEVNSSLGQLKLRIKAQVDMDALDDHLDNCGAVSDQRIGFVVVARRQSDGARNEAFHGNIENGLKEVFGRGGYEIASGLEMELRSGGIYKKNRLVTAYSETGRVNWDAPRIAGLVADVDLLLVGTVDIGGKRTSKSNGKTVVNVTASLDLADLHERVSVASVHNVKLSAEADGEQEATAEAIRMVAAAAARKLLDALSATPAGKGR